MVEFDADFLARLSRLQKLLSRAKVEGAGSAVSRARRGGLIEVAGHRRYAAGDDFRYVDWSVYGRLEKLFVKEFDKEEYVPLLLLIDRSASMSIGDPAKIQHAFQLAASIAYVGLLGENPVTVRLVSDAEVGPARELRRVSSFPGLLDELSRERCSGVADLSLALKRELANRRHPSLIVVISDFFDQDSLAKELKNARASRHDVALLQVLAREEVDPDYEGRSVQLIDAERGASVRLTVGRAELSLYRKELDALVSRYQQLAGRHGMRCQLALSHEPMESTLVEFLRQGGLGR